MSALQDVYRASPIKRNRRTKSEMAAIRTGIRQVLEDDNPMTARQVFYCIEVLGLIKKTEAEYDGTVIRLLTEMRKSGAIPWGWITDYTRVMRKPRSFSSMEDALLHTAQTYRRKIWDRLNVRVEIWLEKDTLAGVLIDETWKYDVPLMVCRGYPSLTFIH